MKCPQPNLIANLVDGRLSPAEISDVEGHLDGCSRCASLVAVAVSSRGGTTVDTVMAGEGSRAAAVGRPEGTVIPPGTRLGRYLVRRWIGRGGMGDVYEGFDPELERKVALKLLRGQGSEGPAAQRRLGREARSLARLSSPNVVAALDVGTYGDRLFLVMELVEGLTLSAWLRAARRSWREILDAFLDAGDGLAAAHEVGVIHRDFKPQNVLIGKDGKARVSDFGLARPSVTVAAVGDAGAGREAAGGETGAGEGDGSAVLAGEERALEVFAGDRDPGEAVGSQDLAERATPQNTDRQTLTETGALIGTPRYMAPEQFLNQPADARADQFSFCVALYEALYGRHPLADDRSVQSEGSFDSFRKAALTSRPSPPPRKTSAAGASGASRSIAAVLMRGLERNPEARFPTMRNLLAAVRAAAGRRRRRGPSVAIAISTVVVLATIAALYALRTTGPIVLAPMGEPADWTNSRIVFRGPERIHCLMRIDNHTIRVVWGEPRKAEDVVLETGGRRPADLVPESYEYGCPQLSPDGRQIIYEGYDGKDRPHIFCAANPTGRDAEPIVASMEPTYDSHPLWLSSGKEFVFDLGLQHPAVFSVETNSYTIISDRDRLSQSQIGFNKSVSPADDRIAILQATGGQAGMLVSIYRWPRMQPEIAFRVSRSISQAWRFGVDSNLLYGGIFDTTLRLVVFDSRTRRLSYVAQVSGRDIHEFLQVNSKTAAILTLRPEWNIRYKDREGMERAIPKDDVSSYRSPTVTEGGDILFVRDRADRSEIMLFRPSDGTLQVLTNGPGHTEVTALPRGQWLMANSLAASGQEILRCSRPSTNAVPRCSRIAVTESTQWLSAGPDGRYFAYVVVGSQGLVVRISSAEGGAAVDLARNVTFCQLLWSSPRTIWYSRRDGRKFRWIEMDVGTRTPTGRTAPGSTGCFNGRPDPAPPMPSPAWQVITVDSDIRLHALP